MVTPRAKSLGSSVEKLAALGFDPIEAMVRQYQSLCEEIQMQEKIALGEIVRLRVDGKAKAYSPDYHMNIIDRAANLAEKLLRYGYGRVLEDKDVVPNTPPVLNINLSDGTTITLNKDDEDVSQGRSDQEAD